MSTPKDGHFCTVADTPSDDGEAVTVLTVTIGATVPTGFEHTAADEVGEKIGVDARISKDRGRIYFQISTDKLPMVSFGNSMYALIMFRCGNHIMSGSSETVHWTGTRAVK